MIKLLDGVDSRYQSCAEYQGPLSRLFKSVELFKPKDTTPYANSERVWLRIDKRLGLLVYVSVTDELKALIEDKSVYGKVENRDIYLQIAKYKEQYCLVMQYQQIIGSYRLFDITDEQYSAFMSEIEGML